MSTLDKLIGWSIQAKKKVIEGKFNYNKDFKEIHRIARSCNTKERLFIFKAARRLLESLAYEVYLYAEDGRKLTPKIFLYQSLKYVMWKHKENKRYGIYLIQWVYTYLCGRQLLPRGVFVFYFLICFLCTTIFAFFYIGGISSTSLDDIPIYWYHYLYYSGMTLTTLGYGDLHAIDAARMGISILEAFVGYLVLGLGVAVVVNFNTHFQPPPSVMDLNRTIGKLKKEITLL